MSLKDATRNAKKRNTYMVLVGETVKERDNLEGTGRRWEGNIILDLEHLEWNNV
jgi:hypothetical protein